MTTAIVFVSTLGLALASFALGATMLLYGG